MKTQAIAIATMTWARNEEEENLLRKSLIALSDFGSTIFVTDGGSTPSFQEFLKSLPNIHVMQPSKGLWLQTKNSLTAAYQSGAEFIFYTEPDKFDFFSRYLSSYFQAATAAAQTGIILASRTVEAFQTFPGFQQMTETTINKCCAEVMLSSFDYVYGPFLMRRDIVPYLSHLPDTIGWGWRPYAFNIAAWLGYTITYEEGNFACPSFQREDVASERIYRMRQLTQNIEGLVLSTQAALKEKHFS